MHSETLDPAHQKVRIDTSLLSNQCQARRSLNPSLSSSAATSRSKQATKQPLLRNPEPLEVLLAQLIISQGLEHRRIHQRAAPTVHVKGPSRPRKRAPGLRNPLPKDMSSNPEITGPGFGGSLSPFPHSSPWDSSTLLSSQAFLIRQGMTLIFPISVPPPSASPHPTSEPSRGS